MKSSKHGGSPETIRCTGLGASCSHQLTCDAHTSDAPSQTNPTNSEQYVQCISFRHPSQPRVHAFVLSLRGACHVSYLELTTSLPATQIATKSRRTRPNSRSCESFLVHSKGPSEKR